MKAKKLRKILRDWNEEIESVEQRIEWIQDAQAESQKAILEVIFSETGRNRVSEAHQRITQETERLNGLRNDLHRRAQEVDRRMASIEEQLEMIQQEYVTQPGFEDLIRRVRNLEEGMASMSTQGNADRDRLNDHLAWASTHSHHAEPNQRWEDGTQHMKGDHRLFDCPHWKCREDAARASAEAKEDLVKMAMHPEEVPLDFSPPIGGVVPQSRYELGLEQGGEIALQLVEQRVRAFLGQMGWNQESPAMKALVAAMWQREAS